MLNCFQALQHEHIIMKLELYLCNKFKSFDLVLLFSLIAYFLNACTRTEGLEFVLWIFFQISCALKFIIAVPIFKP